MSKTLPIVPIRTGVLFPNISLPITAGRAATLRAIEVAMRAPDHRVFAVAQRDNVDDVLPEGLYTVGTIARISGVQPGSNGVRLVLDGIERAIALRIVPQDGYLAATLSTAVEMEAIDPKDAAFVALHREVRERAAELAKKRGISEPAVAQLLGAITAPGQLADIVAGYLDVPAAERQAVLEELGIEDRLRRVLIMVQRQIEVLAAQESIQSKVKEEIGDRQREHYLREQLRAIQEELGEGEVEAGEALDELKSKLAALPLPPEAKKEVDRELARLARAGRESMESQMIRTYLETVAELPWGTRSDEKLDITEAARILEEDHHGLADVKDRVLEFLAVHQLSKGAAKKGRILLFSGPPGVGKTSIAKSIARAMGRNYVRIALGGARDEADIRGHRRTYIGALPGRILAGMKQAGSKNPVFLLDEVDKLGTSYQGDPAAALLEVLDPAQNDSFTDHYLGVPFDLSEVMFIATANFLQNIPGPLLDRMEVVDFAGYTAREKL
ncbi:MAG TPA: LON peptidase substrate-binding domain-containing protein, partial [Kofleriaceae bacterium]|nr:LON peptidase substrate-binding domain-containing protein [Kofleriaceae bacterium]